MPKTIKLRNPIELGSEQITELVFKPLKAKHLRKLSRKDGEEFDLILKLAGRLSGQPDPVIDELEGDDLVEVIEYVAGFMPAGPQTGTELSES